MTKRNRHVSFRAGLVGILLLLPVTQVSAQESGAEMWGRVCGRCHRAQPPNKYDADAWRAIMGHMALTARLTPQEEEAITEFLMAAARPLASHSEPRPEYAVVGRGQLEVSSALYRSQCDVCHGEEGKGDGPAATALTPRPPDLTRSELVRRMSDAELLEYLSVGKGSMPGFGNILTEEDLMVLVQWLRAKNPSNR